MLYRHLQQSLRIVVAADEKGAFELMLGYAFHVFRQGFTFLVIAFSLLAYSSLQSIWFDNKRDDNW